MKTRLTLSLVLAASVSAPAFAADQPEPPVPIKQAYPVTTPPPPETPETAQRLYGPSGTLVAPEKAKQVIDAFRGTYEKLNKPRVLFFVNRELVDENAGLKLSGRTEKTESTLSEKKSNFEGDPKPAGTTTAPQTQVNVVVNGSTGNRDDAARHGKGSSESKSTTVSAQNTYTAGDKTAPTLADKQTVREVERLFGRPFRMAGAALADQKVAASLIADKPLDHFVAPANDAARKDREALAKVADVAIEVLVASRNVTVTGVSEDKVVSVPDIQVTAVRLSDSAIIGQASSADILGRGQQAGRVARQYDVRDITEATALALMEDMTLTSK
ncbi:MAG: hypothetical protein QM715_11390 [Nibricoccus sp.]